MLGNLGNGDVLSIPDFQNSRYNQMFLKIMINISNLATGKDIYRMCLKSLHLTTRICNYIINLK